jgi:hypothetical protein
MAVSVNRNPLFIGKTSRSGAEYSENEGYKEYKYYLIRIRIKSNKEEKKDIAF